MAESFKLLPDGTRMASGPPFKTLFRHFVLRDLWTHERARAHKVLFVKSLTFGGFMMTVIMVNSFILGIEVHINAVLERRNLPASEEQKNIFFALEIIFTGLYVFEIFMKMLEDRWRFFEDLWNCYDYVIVAATTASLVRSLLANEAEKEGGAGKVVAVLRVGRIFRLGRVLVLFKGLSTLKYLYQGMFKAAPAIMYMAAIMFFPLFFIASNTVNQMLPVNHPSPLRRIFFRNVLAGSFTWFEMITGEANGVMRGILDFREDFDPDFGEPVPRLSGSGSPDYDVETDEGNPKRILFICTAVIMLAKYSCLATLTGLIISRVSTITEEWRDAKQRQEDAKQHDLMQDIAEIFHEGDINEDGFLTMDEFWVTLQSERLKARLSAKLGVTPNDLIELFSMLKQMAFEGDAFVPNQKFLHSLVGLPGLAKAVHMYVLHNAVRQIMKKCEELVDRVSFNFNLMGTVEARILDEFEEPYEKIQTQSRLRHETRVQSSRAHAERLKLESAVDIARPRVKPGLSSRRVQAISRGEQVSGPNSRQGSRQGSREGSGQGARPGDRAPATGRVALSRERELGRRDGRSMRSSASRRVAAASTWFDDETASRFIEVSTGVQPPPSQAFVDPPPPSELPPSR